MLHLDPSRLTTLIPSIPPDAWITVYARVSSAAQLQGHGITRQLEDGRKLVEALGRIPTEILIDDGISARKGDHLKFGKLGLYIERIHEAPPGSILVLERVDRLTRERTTKFGEMLFKLINSGVTIIFYADGRVYNADNVDDNLLHLMQAFMDANVGHKENERKSDRLKRTWAIKRPNVAAQDFSRPFEPYNGATCPDWLEWRQEGPNPKAGRYHPIPERVVVVQQIFDWLIAGAGRDQIAKMLNISGIKPWGKGKSGKWQGGCVYPITERRRVLGEFQMHTSESYHNKRGTRRVKWGEPIKGYYPQVISDEVWRASRVVTERRRMRKIGNVGGRKGTKASNMLAERAFCAVCGAKFRIKPGRVSPTHVPKFKCRGVEQGDCTNKTLYPYPAVEQAVLDWAVDYVPSIAKAEQVVVLERELARLQNERDADFERRGDMLERWNKNDIQANMIIDRLEQSIAALDAEILTTIYKLDQARRTELTHRTLIQEMPGKLLEAQNDAEVFAIRSAVRESIREIIDRVIFYPDGFWIEVIGGVYEIEFDLTGKHTVTRSVFVFSEAADDATEAMRDWYINQYPSETVPRIKDKLFHAWAVSEGRTETVFRTETKELYRLSDDASCPWYERPFRRVALPPIKRGEPRGSR